LKFDSHLAGQEILCFYGKWRFITVLTKTWPCTLS